MALEPRTVSLDTEENPELIDITRRFKVGTVMTIPLVYIAMDSYIPAISPEKFIPMEMLKWLELILATPVVLWGGWLKGNTFASLNKGGPDFGLSVGIVRWF